MKCGKRPKRERTWLKLDIWKKWDKFETGTFLKCQRKERSLGEREEQQSPGCWYSKVRGAFLWWTAWWPEFPKLALSLDLEENHVGFSVGSRALHFHSFCFPEAWNSPTACKSILGEKIKKASLRASVSFGELRLYRVGRFFNTSDKDKIP